MRLSIIVPVYNVEKYLERCVESVFRQNLAEDDFEIVMVNDGSTDGSYQVAQELASRYSQIKLYSQENGGLSAARNTGLKHASGRYIQFLDSDDWLLDESLCPILKIADDRDLDICAFRMKVLDHQGRVASHSYEQPFDLYKIYKGEYVVTHGLHFDSVCSNLYKRSFLNKECLMFAVGLTHEDVDFNSRAMALARKIMFTDKVSYIYFWNDESLNRSVDYDKIKKAKIDDIKIAVRMRDFALQRQNNIKKCYVRRSNSIVFSQLWGFYKNQNLPQDIKDDCIAVARANRLLPIRGRTSSWKSSILIPFINLMVKFKMI